MRASDRNGSNGQKGSHNSKFADHAGPVRKAVMVFCQPAPVAATMSAKPIVALPTILLKSGVGLADYTQRIFPQAAIRNANAVNPAQ